MREFKLPDVGEGVAEGELLEWHVQPGDRVEEDQVVAEVETDKAVVDVPSPVDGTVRELLADPGDVVPVGEVIITFDVDGETDEEAAEARKASEPAGEATEAGAASEGAAGKAAPDEEAAPSTDSQRGGRVFAPPSARRLARELGVDIGSVAGSGPGGRVTEADVRAAAEGGEKEEETELKSAVSKIGSGKAGEPEDGETELKSAVSKIDAEKAEGTEDGETATRAPSAAGRERTLAAPSTRREAEELGVDIDDVPASEQRDGEAFVTAEAVHEYAETQQRAREAEREAVAETRAETEAGTAPAVEGETAGEAVAAGDVDRREPYRGVRRTIGEAMQRSKFTAPHVTHHETLDATALVETRERLKPRAAERDVKLTYLPFVMKAVVAALKEHPVLNTRLDEENDEIVYRSDYNVGVATATDAGLMVPVVDDVDEKGLVELAAESRELAEKARERSITREEMQGGTFTVTNFGAIGGEYATPIINYPETAILGLGELAERPMAVDGEVVARDTLPLSLSIDHRVIDGADAGRFTNTLVEYLEDPTLLLLE